MSSKKSFSNTQQMSTTVDQTLEEEKTPAVLKPKELSVQEADILKKTWHLAYEAQISKVEELKKDKKKVYDHEVSQLISSDTLIAKLEWEMRSLLWKPRLLKSKLSSLMKSWQPTLITWTILYYENKFSSSSSTNEIDSSSKNSDQSSLLFKLCRNSFAFMLQMLNVCSKQFDSILQVSHFLLKLKMIWQSTILQK